MVSLVLCGWGDAGECAYGACVIEIAWWKEAKVELGAPHFEFILAK